MRITRRRFLTRGTIAAGGVALGIGSAAALTGEGSPFDEPLEDPNGLLDLPPGFRYRVVSEEGSALSTGARVPGDFDGMAAFPGRHRETVLVRNHELSYPGDEPVAGSNPYDGGEPGGTTALVIDRDRTPVREFVTSSGTRDNCAGGATPWGTWITCEEDLADGHGYAFEVDPQDPENALSRTPIRQMGRFSHEAVGVDRRTGTVYLTEDMAGPGEPDPGPSFLYRFLPDDESPRAGALQRGGRLQALAIEESRKAGPSLSGGRPGVLWRDVDPEDPHADARAKACVRFNRLEGCHFAGGVLWFADTSGGQAGLGQIFRYLPATNTLELFSEAAPESGIESPDNLVVTPFGDLWFCTDGRNQVMGITPEGRVYEFATNRLSDSELAGPTFAPDGRTFFVNVQSPGVTLAVWGPFEGYANDRRGQGRSVPGWALARQRQMAVATPPARMAPKVSLELAEAASRRGMTVLEAAAYVRFGMALD